MRTMTLVFAIGLALATTADGALAQNTLLLGRGQPPRQTTVPLTTYPNYGNRPSGQFFAPARPQAYRMPNGRYSITRARLCSADLPSTVWAVNKRKAGGPAQPGCACRKARSRRGLGCARPLGDASFGRSPSASG